MIPDLVRLSEEAQDQKARVETFLERVPETDLLQRPEPGRWSSGEHLKHVALATDAFVSSLRQALERTRGRGGTGPVRRGPVGRFMVRSASPPVKRRVKARQALIPTPPPAPAEVARRFREAQDAYIATIADADGADLGRVAARFPPLPLIRLRTIQMFELVLAHTERHLWLVDETSLRLGSDAPRVSNEPVSR